MKRNEKRLIEFLIVSFVIGGISGNQLIKASENESILKIGDERINVSRLARENGVDEEELRKAIIAGQNMEKASAFGNLKVKDELLENLISNISIEGVISKLSSSMERKVNQDSIGYVAQPGAETASGKSPRIGMCAMHTSVTSRTSKTSKTNIKFGTKIYLDSYVQISGSKYSSFTVEDRGDGDYKSDFWIDMIVRMKC